MRSFKFGASKGMGPIPFVIVFAIVSTLLIAIVTTLGSSVIFRVQYQNAEFSIDKYITYPEKILNDQGVTMGRAIFVWDRFGNGNCDFRSGGSFARKVKVELMGETCELGNGKYDEIYSLRVPVTVYINGEYQTAIMVISY